MASLRAVFEHRGGTACGVSSWSKTRLDAQPLARLDSADDLDKLVAAGIQVTIAPCRPNI